MSSFATSDTNAVIRTIVFLMESINTTYGYVSIFIVYEWNKLYYNM